MVFLQIDLTALGENYKYLSSKTKATCAAVVKADAYGVGVEKIIECLCKNGCKDFFVATFDEAVEVREYLNALEYNTLAHNTLANNTLAYKTNVFILNGLEPAVIEGCIEYKLQPVLKSLFEIKLWLDFCETRQIKAACGLHLDSGMNRFGIGGEDIAKIDLVRLRKNIPKMVILSHLSCASCKDKIIANQRQLERFRDFGKIFDKEILSFCNSAGFLLDEEYHFDLARLGLILYGINPHEERHFEMDNLKTVVKLYSPMLQVKTIRKGDTIGYGATWRADCDTVVGIIAAGYADGLPLNASNRAILCVGGYPAAVIGKVSMDMTVISLQDVPEEIRKEGVDVEIFGKNAPIEKFAKYCQSHPHEILTRIGKRVERIYKSF